MTGMIAAMAAGRRTGAYLQVMAVGSGARMFGLASQFVVLILLGRILSKDAFGEMMIAFGFYRLLGTALGVGGSLVLLYHVSRNPEDRSAEVRLHRFSALLGGALASALALAAALASPEIAAALGKPGLAAWLVLLTPFAVFSTLLSIATGAMEGRSSVSESILVSEVAPSAARILLLPLVALLGLHDTAVAHVLTLSVLLPWLWASRGLFSRDIVGMKTWSGWDARYSCKVVAATLFANQLGAIDLVIAGALFSSATVADYAVATRLAGLFTFFQLVLLKRFAPRAGGLLQSRDLAALRVDAELCRRLTVGSTALTAAGILASAPLILPLFGNFGGATAFLVWLAIPSCTTAFYATSDRLLMIAGKADVLLALTVSSFLMLAVTPFMTAGILGLAAIPTAMILSALLLNPIVAVSLRRACRVDTIRPLDAAVIASLCLALGYHGATVSSVSTALACGMLVLVGAGYLAAAARVTREPTKT